MYNFRVYPKKIGGVRFLKPKGVGHIRQILHCNDGTIARNRQELEFISQNEHLSENQVGT